MKTLRELARKLIWAIVIAFLVYAFAQTLPIDLAILVAGDALFYFEAAAAVWLAGQVTRIRWAVVYVRFALPRVIRRARARARRAARRIRPPSRGDDRPAPVFAWA